MGAQFLYQDSIIILQSGEIKCRLENALKISHWKSAAWSTMWANYTLRKTLPLLATSSLCFACKTKYTLSSQRSYKAWLFQRICEFVEQYFHSILGYKTWQKILLMLKNAIIKIFSVVCTCIKLRQKTAHQAIYTSMANWFKDFRFLHSS